VGYLGKLNKKLLWDYQVSEEDLKEEKVFIFYLSRVLNNGNSADISELPGGSNILCDRGGMAWDKAGCGGISSR